MTPELRKRITDQYVGWAESWGLSLAFAVTQNVERSERAVADAVAALITAEAERTRAAEDSARIERFHQATAKKSDSPSSRVKSTLQQHLPASVNATRFASTVYEIASAQPFRGFGADSFFRMPAIARAIVVLKLKAQLSRVQIAAALHLKLQQVDGHLENARLLFSEGRPWLEASPGLQVEGSSWAPECPQWKATAPRADAALEGTAQDIQDVFAHYVGNDLDTDTGHKLHSHLVVCTTCRSSFAHFKRQYSSWSDSIPLVEPDAELKKNLVRVTKMALKIKRRSAPSPWPGLRRLWGDAQVRAIVLGALSMFVLHAILSKKS